MHAAAIEQFLRTISKLEKQSAKSATPAAIARVTRVSEEQAQEAATALIDRGLVEEIGEDALALTLYGLRRLMTESTEDYLVTIYRLGRVSDGDRVTTSAIAQALGVSAPSVTSMTQRKLSRLSLVDYERHRGVELTPLGEKLALQILRGHRIVELYLTETLGLPWDQVHDEANRLEHAMSPALIEHLAAALGDPLVDPHGDPIPRSDGTVAHSGFTPLYEIPPGATVVVRRIHDQSSAVLRYLGEIELTPGASVSVLARSPFEGPITIRIGECEQVLGRDLARAISVAPAPKHFAESIDGD